MKDVSSLQHGANGFVPRKLRGIATASFSLTLFLAVGTAAGQTWSEQFNLTAADASFGDLFGLSVGISGNTAIVGVFEKVDDTGGTTGSAYLYNVTTGSQLIKLTSDVTRRDQFGVSVAIDGNIAIVGADRDDSAGTDFGAVYAFDVTTGEKLFKFTASDAAKWDDFGRSVAISGSTAIVGALRNDDAGNRSGSAYLFDVTNGQELFKLTASDAAANDWFGESVAISGEVAIVGAFQNDDAGSVSGSAYLFDVTTGRQLFKLTASDAAEGDQFGGSVAISGNTAIVGARLDDTPGGGGGSAYLFDVTTGKELFKLTASDAASGDWFGDSVAISGGTAIVGARNDDDAGNASGSAYLFDVTTGRELLKLTASDAAESGHFGRVVSISDNSAIVGALNGNPSGRNRGSAYFFTSSSSLSDLTGNGFVDFEDLTVLLTNWNKDVTAAEGNLVEPLITVVNFQDLTVLLGDWTGPGPAGAPEAALGDVVPEPSSLLLALLATLGLSFYRRRRQRAF